MRLLARLNGSIARNDADSHGENSHDQGCSEPLSEPEQQPEVVSIHHDPAYQPGGSDAIRISHDPLYRSTVRQVISITHDRTANAETGTVGRTPSEDAENASEAVVIEARSENEERDETPNLDSTHVSPSVIRITLDGSSIQQNQSSGNGGGQITISMSDDTQDDTAGGESNETSAVTLENGSASAQNEGTTTELREEPTPTTPGTKRINILMTGLGVNDSDSQDVRPYPFRSTDDE